MKPTRQVEALAVELFASHGGRRRPAYQSAAVAWQLEPATVRRFYRSLARTALRWMATDDAPTTTVSHGGA